LIFKDESYKIIGACMEVHKKLGPGFLESVYSEALELEFNKAAIPYETTMNKIYSHKSTIIIFMGVTSNTYKN